MGQSLGGPKCTFPKQGYKWMTTCTEKVANYWIQKRKDVTGFKDTTSVYCIPTDKKWHKTKMYDAEPI